MKITKQEMTRILAIIAREENKEGQVRLGLNCIMEGNGFVDITAGMFEVIKMLLPHELYEQLSYYLWECNRKGQIITAKQKTYFFETDEQFIDYLVAEGFIS